MHERPDDFDDPLLSARIKAAIESDRAPSHLVRRLEDRARVGAGPVVTRRPVRPSLVELPQWAGVALVASLLLGAARTLGFGRAWGEMMRHAGGTIELPAGGPSIAMILTLIGLLLAALEAMRRSAGRR